MNISENSTATRELASSQEISDHKVNDKLAILQKEIKNVVYISMWLHISLNKFKLSPIQGLKVVSATFLLVCFLCLNESTSETNKMFFIALRKLFLFLR